MNKHCKKVLADKVTTSYLTV